MKILAIDSSGLTASAAIWEEDRLTAEYSINYKKTHSQTLLPMLDEIKRMTNLDLSTIDAIAVAAGPGSFTGLRIGSATAKGLGLALDKPIIPVPTVDGIAWQMYGCDSLICPIMDARRNQVYTGLYEFVSNKEKDSLEVKYEFHVLMKQCAQSMEKTISDCNEQGRHVIFLGDGVPVFEQMIREKITVPYSFAPNYRRMQSASAVATYARVLYEQGIYEDADTHQPEYLRLSQAERERLEKEGKTC